MKRKVFTLKTLLLIMLMSWTLHGHTLSPILNTGFNSSAEQTVDAYGSSDHDFKSGFAETLAEHSHNHHTKDHWHESLFMPESSGFQSVGSLGNKLDRIQSFVPEAPVFPHEKPPRDVAAQLTLNS